MAAAGNSAEEPVPVAIETPRGLLVMVLRASGRPVYPINPLAVARYRERSSGEVNTGIAPMLPAVEYSQKAPSAYRTAGSGWFVGSTGF